MSETAVPARTLGSTRRLIIYLLIICAAMSILATMSTQIRLSSFDLTAGGHGEIVFDNDEKDTSSVDNDYEAATAMAKKRQAETSNNENGGKSSINDDNNDDDSDSGETEKYAVNQNDGNNDDDDDTVENVEARSGDPEDNGSKNDKDRSRMNVVVLFPDDWRYNSIGAENPIIKTPFLDSLADQGMRFRQNAVTTSICWQSRATLFTGQWASRHKSYKLKCPHFAKGKNWNSTWPAILRDDGYYVGHVGKWQYHNDNKGRFDFDRYFEGKHWYTNGRGKPLIAGEDKARDETINFLNARPKEKPFALTVAFYPPKPVGNSDEPGGQWIPKNFTRALYDNITIPEPYNHTKSFHLLPEFLQRYGSAARARWRGRYTTPEHYQEAMKNIYALITQVDQACKEIVDELKKQDLFNNTMIIFTTDNGMFHGAHGLAGKWYPYQESIRVPLIIYDPRMPADKVGMVDESFTLNVDLAETILGAAGLKPHERMQGRDMSDLYLPNIKNGKTALERKPWRDEFFYEFTFLDERFIPGSNALVRKKWKLIHWYHYERYQLFDLENDSLELNDVVDDPSNAEIVSEMKKRLIEIRDGMKEPDKGCDRGDYSLTAPDEEAIKAAEEAKRKMQEAMNKTIEAKEAANESSTETKIKAGEKLPEAKNKVEEARISLEIASKGR
jgi:arylsulfatase